MEKIFVKCKKGTVRRYTTEKVYVETRNVEFSNSTGHRAHVVKKINKDTDFENNYGYSNMRLLTDDKITKIRFDIGYNMIQYISGGTLNLLENNVIPAVKSNDYTLQITSQSITKFKIIYDVYKIVNLNCKFLCSLSKNLKTNEVHNLCFYTDEDLPPVYQLKK